jgi:oligopeptide/dipeptide ABC transporter ATP-binding protein
MYLGKIVEIAETEELYENPLHPYTQALLSSIPKIGRWRTKGDGEKKFILGGDVPSSIDPPSGCAFRTRCGRVFDRCAEEAPRSIEMKMKMGTNHKVACWLYE